MDCKRKYVAVFGINVVSLVVAVLVFVAVTSLFGLMAAVLVAVTVAFVTMIARHEVSLIAIGYISIIAAAILLDNWVLMSVGAVLTLAFVIASMVNGRTEHAEP